MLWNKPCPIPKYINVRYENETATFKLKLSCKNICKNYAVNLKEEQKTQVLFENVCVYPAGSGGGTL